MNDYDAILCSDCMDDKGLLAAEPYAEWVECICDECGDHSCYCAGVDTEVDHD